jgi:hypothetical protein
MSGYIVQNQNSGYRSPGFINNAGSIDLEVYANNACTKNTGYLVRMGTVGWVSDGTVVSATYGWAYVGFPRGTMSTGDVGRFQIGGFISGAILGASVTGTAGSAVEWAAATLTGAGAVPGSSTSMSQFGVFATAQSAATTVHDLFLYPVRVQCALA